MKKPSRSLSDHLYRTLLFLYPRPFREKYGRDMESLFRDQRQHVGGRVSSFLLLWVKAILDLGIQASAEHLRRHRSRQQHLRNGAKASAGKPGSMWPWWDTLKVSARTLAKKPGYSSVAILTLALGMGAAMAVFALVDGVLIRPLPFSEAEELVAIGHWAREGQDQVSLSDGLYVLYREQASSIETLALYDWVEMSLVSHGEPEQVPIQRATPSFFTLLGVPPALGRTFLPDEELPGQEPVVVLSHGLWQRDFGSDPEALDKILELDGIRRRVVGVMPPGFGYPDRGFRAWVPYEVDPAQEGLTNFYGNGLARLAPASKLKALDTELQGLLSRLTALYPESGGAGFLADVGIKTRNRPLKEDLVGDIEPTLWILFGTVGLVLLIACANVANLALVRAEGRRQELAVRLAMGAGRREVFRLFMGESLILVGAAAILGLVIADWALRITLGLIPFDLPRAAEIGIDPRILAFASLLSMACCIVLGLIPLARARVAGLAGSLRDGGERGATSGRKTHRLRDGLAVVQVALALVLLVGAGLMFRSFQALGRVDPGFHTEGLLTARVIVPPGEIQGWDETASFFRQLQQRLSAQPGVEGAGLTRRVPLSGTLGFTTVDLEGRPEEPGADYIVAHLAFSGPGYLEAMGIPLVEGRALQAGDGAQGLRAALVSESFARRWWPDGSPLGRRISGGGLLSQDWWEVVGVVGDVHQASLAQDPEHLVYLPITTGSREAPYTTRAMDVVVRTTTGPLGFLPVLQRELNALNSRIPVANPRSMTAVVNQANAQTSFTMAMLGASAGIALLLGLVGIYGVVSYLVSLRRREIGVRMALGATTTSVRGMVVKQGLALGVGGVALGLIAAGFFSSLMSSLLFGVRSLDPATYISVSVALVTVSALASWLPARRAAGVDPSVALRED